MVRIAVIGLGNMGRHHARVYSELKEARLVALSDLNEEVGVEVARRYHASFYRDYRAMLEKEEIDAVSVAVPTSLHRKVALACIRSGRPVLVEKPIADTSEAAGAIIEEAQNANVIMAVGHIERFNPSVQKLREIIAGGNLGEITSIVARRVGIFPPRVKDADVIVDLAVHDIDVCNFLLDRLPRKVYARAGKALNSKRADFAALLLDYSGTDALIQTNWITPVKIRELNVTGTGGHAELNYITQDLKTYRSTYEKSFDSFGDFVVKFGAPHVQEVSLKTEEPLRRELEHFVHCVSTGEAPLVSGKDGLCALQIALKAVQSYKQDRIEEIRYDL